MWRPALLLLWLAFSRTATTSLERTNCYKMWAITPRCFFSRYLLRVAINSVLVYSRRTFSRWSRPTKGNRWSCSCTTYRQIPAGRWWSHPTERGAGRAGMCTRTKAPASFNSHRINTPESAWHHFACMNSSLVTSYLTLSLKYSCSRFSLGCGIGYGYLHRIPAQPAASTARPAPSAAAPPVPSPEENPPVNLPAHGFTEVRLNLHFTSVTIRSLTSGNNPIWDDRHFPKCVV